MASHLLFLFPSSGHTSHCEVRLAPDYFSFLKWRMSSFSLAYLTCLPACLGSPFLSPFLLLWVPSFLTFFPVISFIHPSIRFSLLSYILMSLRLTASFLPRFFTFCFFPSHCSSPPFLFTEFLDWLITRLRIVLCCMECARRWWTWQTRLINQTFLMKWNSLGNLRKSNYQNSLKRWDCLVSF